VILNSRVIFTGLMLAIFVAMDAMALTYPYKAGLMPLVVGLPGAVLCLFQVIVELRRAGATPVMLAPVGRELQMFCWLAAFAVAILLLGFLIAVPLMLYLYLRFDSHEPQWLSLTIALAGVVVIYGVFDQLLAVQLWDGFLPPMIMDWWSGE
jgi:hypothetical protein